MDSSIFSRMGLDTSKETAAVLFLCNISGHSVILINGKEHRIATYLGAKVEHMGKDFVTVKQGDYRLTARLLRKNPHPLAAPSHGLMNRTIHESASCKAYYRFSYRGEVLCEFTSDRSSFEFEYK